MDAPLLLQHKPWWWLLQSECYCSWCCSSALWTWRGFWGVALLSGYRHSNARLHSSLVVIVYLLLVAAGLWVLWIPTNSVVVVAYQCCAAAAVAAL